MRLIILLVALAVIGLLVVRQLGPSEPRPESRKVATEMPDPPGVPAEVNQVPPFEQQMNDFMQDAARQRREDVDREAR